MNHLHQLYSLLALLLLTSFAMANEVYEGHSGLITQAIDSNDVIRIDNHPYRVTHNTRFGLMISPEAVRYINRGEFTFEVGAPVYFDFQSADAQGRYDSLIFLFGSID